MRVRRAGAVVFTCAALGVATTFAIAWTLSYTAEGLDTRDGLIDEKHYAIIWNTSRGDLVAARVSESRWVGVTYISFDAESPPTTVGPLPPPQMIPGWALPHIDGIATAYPSPVNLGGPDEHSERTSTVLVGTGWPWHGVACVAKARSTANLAAWPGFGEWPGPGVARVLEDGFVVQRPVRKSDLGHAVMHPSGLQVPLPYRPLWRGLLADSALFATAWAALLLAPFVPGRLRRLVRRRRGRCLRCGYSLAGLPTGSACPECGPKPR